MKLAPQSQRTFFVTSVTAQRRRILQSLHMANLLIGVLRENREKRRLQLHEFVIMPDHVHLILTPAPEISLEKAMQFVKGGFSYRAKKELGYLFEVWERSFTEHRIKDYEEFKTHRDYVLKNPLKAGLVSYPYSSTSALMELDPIPPWLKPQSRVASSQS